MRIDNLIGIGFALLAGFCFHASIESAYWHQVTNETFAGGFGFIFLICAFVSIALIE